jgi:hypothetical protein
MPGCGRLMRQQARPSHTIMGPDDHMIDEGRACLSPALISSNQTLPPPGRQPNSPYLLRDLLRDRNETVMQVVGAHVWIQPYYSVAHPEHHGLCVLPPIIG